MTQENCNADKKEAEILKPSSTSSMFIKPGTDVTLGAEESQLSFRLIEHCWTCRKRVGLFKGFRCRCGELLCRRHRFSDKHDCSFDYKAAGREEIYKANPLVRASKIIKI